MSPLSVSKAEQARATAALDGVPLLSVSLKTATIDGDFYFDCSGNLLQVVARGMADCRAQLPRT